MNSYDQRDEDMNKELSSFGWQGIRNFIFSHVAYYFMDSRTRFVHLTTCSGRATVPDLLQNGFHGDALSLKTAWSSIGQVALRSQDVLSHKLQVVME